LSTMLKNCLRSVVRGRRRTVVRICSWLFAKSLGADGCGRMLIVAPHPDDEVFGCGGLMLQRLRAGWDVNVVILTGGGGSHKGCCDMPEEEIIAKRKRLCIRAGKTIGLDFGNIHFLDFKDGSLPRKNDAGFDDCVSVLREYIRRFNPSELYCPHFLDGWSDHVAASEITVAAAGFCKNINLYYYIVWAWMNTRLPALLRMGWKRSRKANIKDVFDKKQKAIGLYLEECSPKCGKPYSGELPPDFLKSFEWPCELFFEKIERCKDNE